MFISNVFIFIFACFLFFSDINSESLQEANDLDQNVPNSNKNRMKILDLKRRKEIVEKYTNSLAKEKESWVDPYEMINFQEKDCEEAIPKPSEIPVSSSIPLDLDSDDEPLFSDIKGDVIGSKAPKLDIISDAGVESEKLFSKGRQQICVLDSIYISRWLKRLLLKIEKESDQEPSSVTYPMDFSTLERLKELSTAKSIEIVQLDELVCKIISQAHIARIEDFDWTAVTAYVTKVCWVVVFIVAVGISAYGIHQCILHYPKWTIVGCVMILCVFWHWMHMYKQRQAYKHAELSSMKIPDDCRKFEFGLMEHVHNYIKSYFSKNECATYYEALMVDPFWEVSLSVAVAETVAAMIFQPLSAASRILNSSLKQLFDGLSVIIIIPVVIFFFLLLVMMCNYRIRLPFFMGALEPHVQSMGGSRVQDVPPRKAVAMSSSNNAIKNACSIQAKEDKILFQKQESDIHNVISSDRVFVKSVSNSLRDAINSSLVKTSAEPGHSGNLELGGENYNDLEPEASFTEDEDYSENDSENLNSDEERPLTPDLSSESQHCCSCYLHSEDIQYMHEDCRVCNRTEGYDVLHEQENENVENGFGKYDKIDITKEQASVDFRDKQLYSV